MLNKQAGAVEGSGEEEESDEKKKEDEDKKKATDKANEPSAEDKAKAWFAGGDKKTDDTPKNGDDKKGH